MTIPDRNRAAVYHSNRDIRVEDRPVPAVGPGELLLRVHASGICGSDLLEWYRRPKAPTVLGHEVAGRVLAVGEGVERFGVGDRVMATHHVPCLDCRYCRSGRETACDMLRRTGFDPGGFADLIRLPALNVERGVLKLPGHVSDDAGSLVEPLACVVRGQGQIELGAGESVLIIGSGIAGCLHLLAAGALGAGPLLVSDIRESRLDFAESLGADAALDAHGPLAERVHERLGHGADRVIVCTGARSAIEQAFAAVDRGGTILFFAPMGPEEEYPIPFDRVFWRNGVTLTSSYGAAPRNLRDALELISSGAVDVTPLVTHHLPLSEIGTGFEMMLDGSDSLKIIIDPRLDASA